MSSQPQGPRVSLSPALLPSSVTLHGRTVSLAHLRPEHADDLYDSISGDSPTSAQLWDYMGDGPYEDRESFRSAVAGKSASVDPFYFAVIDKDNAKSGLERSSTGRVVGYLSLMRITPEHLTVEIGNVLLSPLLQRTTGATEAIYLLIQHSFHDLRNRRVEWKCNALNEPSKRAALRLGFTFEGVFRQHMIVKGRNRDTAWYSMLKDEWDGGLRDAMEKWLDEENFYGDGKQKKRLKNYRNDLQREN